MNICWFGRMGHVPKQSRYVRSPASGAVSLCDPRTKTFGDPGLQDSFLIIKCRTLTTLHHHHCRRHHRGYQATDKHLPSPISRIGDLLPAAFPQLGFSEKRRQNRSREEVRHEISKEDIILRGRF